MDKQMIDRFLDVYRTEYLDDIMKLIRIRSVSVPSSGGKYPFGDGCAQVLDTALSLGKEMGFATENHDYYCGSILMPGTAVGEIGMFAHLDIVPEGEGWLQPPYIPYIKDGWLYGRGSSDNKGPAVTALYAMRCLQKSGIRLRHTVRLFLGCSEENGMSDIDYYLKRVPAPEYSFVPDASFSVCYSEKGILELEFTSPLPAGVADFTAGEASNMVAGNAYALVDTIQGELPEVNKESCPGVVVREQDGMLRVEAAGKSAHAAFPEGSINASVMLADYLCGHPFLTDKAKRTLAFLSECFENYYGEALGIAYDGGPLGKLTIVAGMTRTEDGKIRQNVNIRYPAGVNAEKMMERLNTAAASYGWSMRTVRHEEPAYVSPDSPFVKTLDHICKQRLGEAFGPYTMGGGTYARKLPNAVAFGPSIKGQKKPGPDGHGGGHQPDECVRIQGLEDALHIYVQSLLALDEIF